MVLENNTKNKAFEGIEMFLLLKKIHNFPKVLVKEENSLIFTTSYCTNPLPFKNGVHCFEHKELFLTERAKKSTNLFIHFQTSLAKRCSRRYLSLVLTLSFSFIIP